MNVRPRGGGGRGPRRDKYALKRPPSRCPGPVLWRPHSQSAALTRLFSGRPGQAQTVDEH